MYFYRFAVNKRCSKAPIASQCPRTVCKRGWEWCSLAVKNSRAAALRGPVTYIHLTEWRSLCLPLQAIVVVFVVVVVRTKHCSRSQAR